MRCLCWQCEIERLTFAVWAYRKGLEFKREQLDVVDPKNPPRNLFRLAGVINSANREADDEAGALIARIRKNQSRTLGLITKGHQNESLREQMLSEAEKEQALSDLEASLGDNGAPLDDEETTDQAREKLREAKAARSSNGSGSTEKPGETPKAESGTQQHETQNNEQTATASPPEVGPTNTFQSG